MARLTFHVSMSLDGYITGPNPRPDEPLGDGGERLHEWMSGLGDYRASHRPASSTPDAEVIDEYTEAIGALIMGKRMFDVGEVHWGDDPPWGMPVFVVTHHARGVVAKQGGTTYTFVTDGIEAALHQAQAAAGDKDVGVAGGANLIQQYLNAGVLDDLEIHVVPVLLGGGVRLFDHLGSEPVELEATRVIESSAVTHLRLRVVKSSALGNRA